MKAAVIRQYGQIGLEEVTKPEMPDGNVLIRVKYASICGSDQHIFKGEFHPRTRLPLIAGHEFAGIVEDTASPKFRRGEKVTVDPIIWCGKCAACREGHYPACTTLKLVGIDLDGGFGEFVSVPESMVFPVPVNIPDEHAAMVEILSIGFHAINRAGLQPGEDILIMGCGKVGQSILHAARTVTKGKVFIADMLEKRLSMASAAFPDVRTIDVRSSDPVAVIMDETGGKGVDRAFEAVGHFAVLDGRFNPVRTCIKAIKGSGTVCVLGLGDEPMDILMKELIWKEAKLVASRVSHGEFSRAIDALATGSLDPSKMITGILDLSKAGEAFEMLEKNPGDNLKILLKVCC